jgi:predicted dehydrogenase
LKENANFEIVGAVDVYPERAKFYNEIVEREIPIYKDMDDFYADGKVADLALIATPIHFHTRQILTALENGSNVLCEKPLSGVSADAELIEKRAKELGKWVMIGYQWSYSAAILALKEDVLNGTLGKPVFLKTITLWPRKKEYFARGTGWAGKLKASDGTVINDSVAANATAHYLHNILFVCGERYLAAEAKNIKADLIRVNPIENFDNITLSFSLECGAKCLFIAAHSCNEEHSPIFEYRFEKATITYNEEMKSLVAHLDDGTEKNYGNPESDGHSKKGFIAIDGCNEENYVPLCSHTTAAPHARCIAAIQTNKIYDANPEVVKVREEDNLKYIDGFTALLKRCYDEEIMLRDSGEFERLVK